jgi:hypothetical protein
VPPRFPRILRPSLSVGKPGHRRIELVFLSVGEPCRTGPAVWVVLPVVLEGLLRVEGMLVSIQLAARIAGAVFWVAASPRALVCM